MAWFTDTDADEVAAIWADAALIDAETLRLFLDAARDQCLAYAPALPPVAEVPAAWKIAQAYQARNLFNAGKTGTTGDLDGSDYGLVAHPLDWIVKQLLRPRRATGAIW